MNNKSYYDENYFKWQKELGEFGGWAELHKFIYYIKSDFNIIDFGCGGGFLLKNIICKEKIGVEINEFARKKAEENGIKTVEYISELPDNWADLIISNHALEHVHSPLDVLIQLKPKLKKYGTIVFVVPCETIKTKFYPGDINKHLYSWGPMTLGNLFNEAGYKVYQVIPYIHKWPQHYQKIASLFGRRWFNLICMLNARIKRDGYQVKVIAKNE